MLWKPILLRSETQTQISKLSLDGAKPAAAGIGTTHFSGKRHFASYSGGALLRRTLTLPKLQRCIDRLQFVDFQSARGWTNHPLEGAWPSCWRWRHLCRFGGLLHTSSRIGSKSGKECGQLMERIGGGRCNLQHEAIAIRAGGVSLRPQLARCGLCGRADSLP